MPAAVVLLFAGPVGALFQLPEASSSGGTATSIATLLVQLGLSAVFLWLYLKANVRAEEAEAHARKRDDQIIELASSLGPVVTRNTDVMGRIEQSAALGYTRPPETGSDRVERLLEAVVALLSKEAHGRDT